MSILCAMRGPSSVQTVLVEASIRRPGPESRQAVGAALVIVGLLMIAILLFWLVALQRRARARAAAGRPETRRARKLSFPPPARIPYFPPYQDSVAPPPARRTPSGGKVDE